MKFGHSVIIFVVSSSLFFGTVAMAGSCKIGDVSRSCEWNCGSGPCAPPSFEWCDTNGDGVCTICGTRRGDYIVGTDGDDMICGKGGDDQIVGSLFDSAGNDLIDGGPGDDWIRGTDGDDDLRGNSGDDVLIGGRGNNALRGGKGDDTLYNDFPNDFSVLGGTVCGGRGNDRILVWSYGYQCIDGGQDQVASGEDWDCRYFTPIHNERNRGTIRNCANITGDMEPISPPCGCE